MGGISITTARRPQVILYSSVFWAGQASPAVVAFDQVLFNTSPVAIVPSNATDFSAFQNIYPDDDWLVTLQYYLSPGGAAFTWYAQIGDGGAASRHWLSQPMMGTPDGLLVGQNTFVLHTGNSQLGNVPVPIVCRFITDGVADVLTGGEVRMSVGPLFIKSQ